MGRSLWGSCLCGGGDVKGVVARVRCWVLIGYNKIWVLTLDSAVDMPVSITTVAVALVHRFYRTHNHVQINDSLIRPSPSFWREKPSRK